MCTIVYYVQDILNPFLIGFAHPGPGRMSLLKQHIVPNCWSADVGFQLCPMLQYAATSSISLLTSAAHFFCLASCHWTDSGHQELIPDAPSFSAHQGHVSLACSPGIEARRVICCSLLLLTSSAHLCCSLMRSLMLLTYAAHVCCSLLLSLSLLPLDWLGPPRACPRCPKLQRPPRPNHSMLPRH